MRQVWEPTSRRSEDEAPLAGMERVRGVAYLVLSTAGEWILIVALVAAIVLVAFGTDVLDWLGLER